MSTIVDHFVSSPREREKREETVEEMKERDRRERKINTRGPWAMARSPE